MIFDGREDVLQVGTFPTFAPQVLLPTVFPKAILLAGGHKGPRDVGDEEIVRVPKYEMIEGEASARGDI